MFNNPFSDSYIKISQCIPKFMIKHLKNFITHTNPSRVRLRRILGRGEELGLDEEPGVPGVWGWMPDTECSCCADAAMMLEATVVLEARFVMAEARLIPGERADVTWTALVMLVTCRAVAEETED